jgi:hypothetical protein
VQRRIAVVFLVALLMILTGCAMPEGVDGDVGDDWKQMAAPTGFEPVAEACHAGGFADVGLRSAYEAVPCAETHRTETVAVGTFTGEAATAAAPPKKGSAGAREAYASCDEEATAYVGGSWHTARLWLGVVQPSAAAWTGGARWYRCDLLEISSVEDDGDLVARTGTLRDALRVPDSPLLLTCYAVAVDSSGAIDTMPGAACTDTHNAEFVGVWTAPDTLAYPVAGDDWAEFHVGCRTLIAEFVGVPDDKNLEFRTGVVSLPGGQDVWAAGDRAVRCYLWVDGAKLTGSLKGKGDKALPIQYK